MAEVDPFEITEEEEKALGDPDAEAETETEEETEQQDEVEEEGSEKTGDDETPAPGDKKESKKPDYDPYDKIAELERATKGILTSKIEETRKRQEVEGRLNQITQMLNEIVSKRSTTEPEKKEQEKALAKLKAEVDDDGNVVIDSEQLREILKPMFGATEEPVKQLKQEFETVRQAQAQEQAFKKLVNQVLSENDAYPSAYQKVAKAAAWLNDRVVEMQEEMGIQGYISPEIALDVLSGTAVEEEFNKSFPGLDFERTMKAYDSRYSLRKAVQAAAQGVKRPVQPEKRKTDLSKAKALLQKPGSLATAKNQKTVSSDMTVDSIADMSSDDFENLSDADLKKIEKVLRQADG